MRVDLASCFVGSRDFWYGLFMIMTGDQLRGGRVAVLVNGFNSLR